MIAVAHAAGPMSLLLKAGRRARFAIELSSEWAKGASLWDGAETPFQDAAWLGTWYDSLAGRPGLTPLLVTARDAATGEVALRLPLVLRRMGWFTAIEFADLHLTDYNAPALGPAAPRDAEGARVLWRAIRRALPSADLLRLTKMPVMLGQRPNPLALLPGARPCALNGNIVRTGDDYDAWRRGLEKTVRKELERSWRVFSREPGTAFEIVSDPERAKTIVAAMEVQQETRMRSKGAAYALDDPDFARFYRDLVDRGLGTGYAFVTALTAGDAIVASLLGIRDGKSYVMIRISNAAGRWTNCSPGRLIIERTMSALHSQGCRAFDFSVGNYDYKRRFGVEAVQLVDLTRALGPGGIPASLRAKAAGALRQRPELDSKLRALAAKVMTRRA